MKKVLFAYTRNQNKQYQRRSKDLSRTLFIKYLALSINTTLYVNNIYSVLKNPISDRTFFA
ncbi:hypothetical protein GXM_09200 [Nostoc sphaeroides CCNUC1]|uniref:Uncharacterized protein n=1 Tax=Nostoc sphaeroides CCNUC1 TaxID=2653204 RepID=A0A5P8WHR8_9NOSO|nr:hypothetical protein GXM_09200 [Nostoc sphaeroides CCNUC1]